MKIPASRMEPEPFRLAELLRPEGIGFGYEAESPAQVLGQVNALLVRAGFIRPEQAPAARLAFLEQEEITGTGYKYGLAFPHGRGPWPMGAVVGVYPEGVGWSCRDGMPVKVVLGVAMPESGYRSYSLWLPSLAEILIAGGFVEKALSAVSPMEVIEAVEATEDAHYIDFPAYGAAGGQPAP